MALHSTFSCPFYWISNIFICSSRNLLSNQNISTLTHNHVIVKGVDVVHIFIIEAVIKQR